MRRLKLLPAVLMLAGLSGLASGNVFRDDFESYAAGRALHGQGGWKGWDNVAGAGAVISTKFARSGTKSVEILGTTDLVRELTFAGGKWALSVWQYIPSGGTGVSYFILLNTYADRGPKDWSIQTQYNLETGAITCWQGALPGAAEIVFDRWVEIRLLIDLNKDTFEEFYNGRRIAAGRWDDHSHGTLQALDLFGNDASSVYYDDIKIEAYRTDKAGNPQPAHGAAGVATPVFKWTPGDTALFHDVYLGTSPALTAADKVASRLSYPLYYHIAGLEPDAVYYWRVDEIEPMGEIHAGDVWTFTTAPIGVDEGEKKAK
ncbi:MAG: hypothetical protein FJ280_05760 [Planctomycetes bacterium]|nr:hypothetical protein [Planctomycetota bacterium]